MKINELTPDKGSTFVSKRRGRGVGSGNGKLGGRGSKGQNARSGGGVRPGFEGGQMPLQRRLPKRGFVNIYSKCFAEVNVGTLNVFDDGAEIDFDSIKAAGLVGSIEDGLKVLGNGELNKKLTVRATSFSKSAKEKIESLGGKAEVV